MQYSIIITIKQKKLGINVGRALFFIKIVIAAMRIP